MKPPEGFRVPPLHQILGITGELGPDDTGVARLTVDPNVHYGAQYAHGGILGVLVDIAGGVAVARRMPDPFRSVEGTIELKVNYLRKVREGELVATARAVHVGRRIGVADVDVTNDGALVAKAIITYMLVEGARDFPPVTLG
jgi:acyl-CoA thioesterase